VSAGRRWTPLRLLAVAAGIVGMALLIARGLVGWNEARARDLEAACKRAHEAGRYDEEENLARAWMSAAPGAAAPILFLAEAQLGLGRARDAAATFATLPDGDPLTIQGLLERADLLFGELRDPREGARTCERIIAQDPAAIEAHRLSCFFSAITLDRRGLAERARRAIDAGAELPEIFVYLLGSTWLTLSNTRVVNSRWLEAAPDDEQFLVAAALGFASDSGLDDEVDEDAEPLDAPAETEHDRRLRELLERFPANQELLAFFLQKASTRGDVERVTALLAQAPPAAADDNRFWRFKGWVHDQAGEAEEAEAALRRALEIDPFDFLTWHQLAGVLRKAGRMDDAALPARLAAEGRNLQKRILRPADVRAVTPILREMASFARDCGQAGIADRLTRRIAEFSPRGPDGGPGAPGQGSSGAPAAQKP
jgi:thioredoxin-like negative regulator of GroEL